MSRVFVGVSVVKLKSVDEAVKAMQRHGREIMGRWITVSPYTGFVIYTGILGMYKPSLLDLHTGKGGEWASRGREPFLLTEKGRSRRGLLVRMPD
jgi:hypothetical protein